MKAVRSIFRRLAAANGGATAIEYGLIAGLVAMTMVGALSLLGGGTNGMWTMIMTEVQTAAA